MASARWIGIFAVTALVSFGCAKPGTSNGGKDMATSGGDLATTPADQGGTADLAGVVEDLATPGKDAAAPGPCNVVTQTGCADTQKCTYSDPTAGTVMTVCTADGQELAGQPCNDGTNGDCLGANLCTVEDSTANLNICRSWCDADNDCSGLATVGPDNRAYCELPLTGYPSKLCTQPCNPVPGAGPTGCATGLGCVYFSVVRATATLEATHCTKVGAKTATMGCADSSECQSGLICVGINMGASTCRTVCRNQANGLDMKPADCPSGEHCAGLEDVVDPFFGVCIPD